MRPAKKQAQQFRYQTAQLKHLLFLGFLVLFGVIGLLWFARPKTSVLEKRELTKFPEFSLAGVWDGSFFSQVDTWYSDTYPLREGLIGADKKLESLYGIRTQQLVSSGQKADEIPTGTVDLEALAGKSTEPEDSSEATEPAPDTTATPADTEQSTKPAETEKPTDPPETEAPTKPEGDGHGANDVTTPAELSGTIYITQNCGYGVYYFSQSGSAKYCLLVNKLAKAVAGKAQVYDLIGPISAGIMLSDSARESTGGSDENEAMNWMFNNMDASVKKVAVYNTLKAHNDEYIYFHTDHHWTALGAYYAYREFCSQKGITPHALSDFETYTFPGFLGTFYSSSNQSPALASNPDTVTAYIPKGTNSMTMYVSNGNGTYTEYPWRIVNDVSNYAKSELYATFAGGDQPYNYAHNETITDGSAVLIVKDSYGNAFIPFLVDHYEHIYWIDYRSYKSWCAWAGVSDSSISNLVERKNIQDVILCNNINSTGSDSLLKTMEKIFK